MLSLVKNIVCKKKKLEKGGQQRASSTNRQFEHLTAALEAEIGKQLDIVQQNIHEGSPESQTGMDKPEDKEKKNEANRLLML